MDSEKISKKLKEIADYFEDKGISKEQESIYNDLQKLFEEVHISKMQLELSNLELQEKNRQIELEKEKYFNFFNNTPDLNLIISKDGIITDVNLQTCLLFNKKKEQLIGSSIFYFFSSDEAKILLKNINYIAGHNETVHFKLKYYSNIQQTIFFVRAYTFIDDSLQSEMIHLHLTDLNGCFNGDDKPDDSYSSKNNNYFGNSDECSYFISDYKQIEFLSPQCKNLTGYTQDDFIKNPNLITDIVHQDDRERFIRHRNESLDSNAEFEEEYRIITKEGAVKWIHHRCSPKYNNNGYKIGRSVFNKDITEQKNARDKVKYLSEMIDSFLDFLPIPVMIKNINHKYIFINQAACSFIGLSREEINLKNDYEISPKEYADQYLKNDDYVLQSGNMLEMIEEKCYNSGVKKFVITRKILHHDVDGNPIILIAFFDISNIKLIENELNFKSNILNNIFDNVPIGIWLTAPDKSTVLMNKYFQDMLGYSQNKISVKVDEIKEYFDNVENAFIQDYSNITTENFTYIDNLKHILLSIKKKIVDEDNQIIGVLSVNIDITQQYKLEADLKSSLLFLQTLLDAIPNPMFYKDKQLRYIGFNKEFSKYTGKKYEEIINKTPFDVYPGNLGKLYNDKDLELIKNPGSQQYETLVKNADGTYHNVMFYKNTYNDINGEVAGLIGVMIDITNIRTAERKLREYAIEMENKSHALEIEIEEHKKSKKELEIAKEISEQNVQVKNEFLANMSHEIRTPMNVIIGFSELLKFEINTDKGNVFLNNIITSTKNLLHLLDDILELSKTEISNQEANIMSCEWEKVFGELIETYRLQAEEKGITLIETHNDKIPKNLYFDYKRTRHILINLIGNAVKFTEKGSVDISYEYSNLDKVNCKFNFIINVKDTGIGIEKERIEDIFIPFKQLDGKSTRKYGGTGLGLTLVKRLTETMNGTVTVESKIGVGSQFTVTIPEVGYDYDDSIDNIDMQKQELIEDHDCQLIIKNELESINKFAPEIKEQIAQIIEYDLIPAYNSIKYLMLNMDIETFALELIEFSKNNNLSILQDYTEKLLFYSKEFEIQRMEFTFINIGKILEIYLSTLKNQNV